MRRIIFVLVLICFNIISVQEKDFYDLKRIKNVLPDSTEVFQADVINTKILNNLTGFGQILKGKKNNSN